MKGKPPIPSPCGHPDRSIKVGPVKIDGRTVDAKLRYCPKCFVCFKVW